MQLTLKSRPMLHSRIHLLSVCQPRPLRSTTAASPYVIRATPNERPIGPGRGGQRKEPPRGGDDEPTVGGKAGHSLGKVPAGGSQQGRGKSSKSFTPHRNNYQKNGKVTASPAQLNRIIMACWIYFAATKLPKFTAQALSNILWAFAKLGIEDDTFIAALLSVAKRKLPDFKAQELAISLWAAATLGIEDEAFIAAWLPRAKRKLPGFEAQDLSNSLWAAATLGIKDEAFIAAWLRMAKRKLPDFTAQALSNSLWAADKLGIEDVAFIATWLSVATQKLAEFNVIELQQISTAIASRDKWTIDKAFKDRIAARLKEGGRLGYKKGGNLEC
eukprot:gene30056-biopygen15915